MPAFVETVLNRPITSTTRLNRRRCYLRWLPNLTAGGHDRRPLINILGMSPLVALCIVWTMHRSYIGASGRCDKSNLLYLLGYQAFDFHPQSGSYWWRRGR